MKRNNPRFPLFVDLADRKILVVGGGKIASRRVETLCRFGGDITVVAPGMEKILEKLARDGKVRLIRRAYRQEDIRGAWMVLAATDDRELNEEIRRQAKKEGAWVNVASDQELCDFHFPGIVKKDPVVVGINAQGADHRLARRVRERIQRLLDEEIVGGSRMQAGSSLEETGSQTAQDRGKEGDEDETDTCGEP